MGPVYPELVVQRREQAHFEETLRECVRSMPHLGLALLVHALLLLVLASVDIPLPVADEGRVIQAAPPVAEVVEVVRDPERVEPLEQPEELVDAPPVVEDDPVEAPESDVDVPLLVAGADLGVVGELGVGHGTPTLGSGGGHGPGGGPPSARRVQAHILLGLEWLKSHQHPDGFWSAAEFSDQCGRQGGDVLCDGRGNPAFDVGVTALSLLAFLGAGNTDRWGEYERTVKAGLRYLIDVQAEDGLLGSRASTQHTYDHAIATLALCEAYGRSGTFALKQPAVRALQHLAALRTPGSGWRYAPGHPEMGDPARSADTSVTGWALLALLAARKAELPFDEVALRDGLLFLDEMTDPATGRTGYFARGGPVSRELGTEQQWPDHLSEATTAVAVLCRVLADPELQGTRAEELVEKGAALVAALPPVWSEEAFGRRDYYFWYYGAYALFQAGTRQQWDVWERALHDVVMQQQHETGERAGSWDPQHDPWGHQGGRVYATAILTLLAEVYYRYPSLIAEGR